MDFRTLLQSMTNLSEAEGSRVHKGTYGTSHGKEDVRDQYGHKVGKIDKEAGAKKDAPKKGRGRPKKGADDSGEVKQYDTKSLGSVFGGGQKPKKEIGKVSKKHSLKEYMESAEQFKKFESVMEGMFGGGVDHASVASNLAKLARVIKSVETPEQFAVAQKYAQRMSGTIMKHQHDKMGFGSGMRANIGVSRDIQKDLAAKARELGIEYKALEEEEALSVKPMPGASQIIGPDGKPVATADAQTAQVMKQAAAQGKLSIGGQQQGMMEAKKEKEPEGTYSKKRFETDGQRIARLAKEKRQAEKKKSEEKVDESAKPDFLDVDKDSDKKESFKKAVKDKEAKKKVAEGRVHEDSDYTYETVGKILAREKPGMDSSSDDFYSAVYHELIQLGMTPKSANSLLNYNEDFMGDTATAYEHYQSKPGLDEGSIEDHTQHGMDAQPSKLVAVPAKQEPTPWKVDPINAATDRAINFISGLRKPKTFESEDMKDVQFESWEKQLNGLLTEGITVSSSQGQQGQPDSVSVTASDGDAEKLLGVLRNAGIGGFGAGEQAPEIGYGVTQGGEEEFDGTGTEPQAAPDVTDGDDMLSLIKKMSGLSAGPVGGEVVAVGGDEASQDYEDEEGQEAGALEPTDGGDEEGSEEQDSSEEESGDEEEQTDEGNAFTGKLKQTPQGGEFKMGDKSYKDTSEIEEGHDENCNECGYTMENCECEHEQVEENFANSANDPAEQELMKLKALLSMGNDMHKIKHSQAMGNPTKVTMEDTMLKDSTNLLTDWKKLSGI